MYFLSAQEVDKHIINGQYYYYYQSIDKQSLVYHFVVVVLFQSLSRFVSVCNNKASRNIAANLLVCFVIRTLHIICITYRYMYIL